MPRAGLQPSRPRDNGSGPPPTGLTLDLQNRRGTLRASVGVVTATLGNGRHHQRPPRPLPSHSSPALGSRTNGRAPPWHALGCECPGSPAPGSPGPGPGESQFWEFSQSGGECPLSPLPGCGAPFVPCVLPHCHQPLSPQRGSPAVTPDVPSAPERTLGVIEKQTRGPSSHRAAPGPSPAGDRLPHSSLHGGPYPRAAPLVLQPLEGAPRPEAWMGAAACRAVPTGA